MKDKQFSIPPRLKSFKYAFNGLKVLIKEEHNSRIHLIVAIFVIAAGFIFKIEALEWICLIFAIGFVLVAEIINSAIENICDFVSFERNDSIKKIKDLSASAVLVSAFVAVAIGLIIFIPQIIDYV